jgi:hypothetical protein
MEIVARPSDTQMVDTAEASLRALGCRTRAEVEASLELWEWRPPLSRREMAALIARFSIGGGRS